jgi:glutathione S-transferase
MSERGELPTLWQLRVSHFNEKARWALDYKDVPHRRRALAPGFHPRRSKRLGGRGTTPVLVLDGEVIGDSTEIIGYLERRHPDPPLYPDTEAERKAALELEDHFDQQLGPGIRSALFHDLLPYRRTMVPLFTQGLPRRYGLFLHAAYPMARRAIRRGIRADEESARRGREQTIAAIDLIERDLSGDYLVGNRFSVADLTGAALLFPLVAPPEFAYRLPDRWPEGWEEFRRSLADRPGYQWALEMFRRHRGVSAAVSDD